jgi:hypothetical protein
MRHLIDHAMDPDGVDPEDGIRHSVKVAWRALAVAEKVLEHAPFKSGK